MPRSDLPFGSEFSPSQIELPELLGIVVANEGNSPALESSILEQYFSEHAAGQEGTAATANRRTLAYNCKLGLVSYGLIDTTAHLTVFGQRLLALKGDESGLYRELARHILLNLNGMLLVQCIQEMTVAGEEITLTTLRRSLAERNVHFPSGGKHPSIMRLWLAKAGIIIGSRWQVDSIRLQDVLGTNPDNFGALARFTTEQRAFLRALANTNMSVPQGASEIVHLAASIYGVQFPEKNLPKRVLEPLEVAGYITTTKTTTGRGSKPFLVAPTDKLNKDLIEPLLVQLENRVDPKLLDLLKTPLSTILEELRSENRYVAGLALEALAFKLMRFLDISYVATRLRASATGGAEVDLIFESSRLIFSRWQIQCKNTNHVALDDVAKEVGLTHFLKSNVVVIVTSGAIGPEARRYANKIMTDSNLCIVMIDGNDLKLISGRPVAIIDVFTREARHTMDLKKLAL